MQPDQHQRIMGYFIEEAKDHLNTLEQGLLNLQSTIEDSEMVNEVFRAAHSVKGGAAMLGLNSIQHVSHRLEDFFKVLKETPVKVDQKLENLLLRAFDTLKELLEQLQGPFGLTEETANSLLADVEPTFAELEQHLDQLVGVTPQLAGVAGDSAAAQKQLNEELAQLFRSEVPTRLREMLTLFKQTDGENLTRHQLQEICRSLSSLGEQYGLNNWCALLETARKAIAHTDNRYATLAPIVIKDIKQAQELVLLGRLSEIAPCDQLVSLVPVAVEVSNVDENEFLDLLVTIDSDDVMAAPAETAELPVEEFATFGSFDLSNTTSELFEEELLQNGPEVGMAELNSLADLFEGEMPELGLTWQQEEIIEDGSELLTPNLGFSQADEAGDFSDLLFDEPSTKLDSLAASENDDLFGDVFFEETNRATHSSASAAIEADDSNLDDFDDLLQISASNQQQNDSDGGFELDFEEDSEPDGLRFEASTDLFDSSSDSNDLNLDELSEFAPPELDLSFESTNLDGELGGALDGLGELFDGLNEGDLGSSRSQELIPEPTIANSVDEEPFPSFDAEDSVDLLSSNEDLEDLEDLTDSLFNDTSTELDLDLADSFMSNDLSLSVNELNDMEALFGETPQVTESLDSPLPSAVSSEESLDDLLGDVLFDEDLLPASENINLDDSETDEAIRLTAEVPPFQAPEVPDPWGTDEVELVAVESPFDVDLDTPDSSSLSLADLDLSDLGLEEDLTAVAFDDAVSLSDEAAPQEPSDLLSEDTDALFDEPLTDLFTEDLVTDTTELNETEDSSLDLSLESLNLDDFEDLSSAGLDNSISDEFGFGDDRSPDTQELSGALTDDDLIAFDLPDLTEDLPEDAAQQDLENLFEDSSVLEGEPSDELDLADLSISDSNDLILDTESLNFGSDDQLTNLSNDDFFSSETDLASHLTLEDELSLSSDLADVIDSFGDATISEDISGFDTDDTAIALDALDKNISLEEIEENALEWPLDNLSNALESEPSESVDVFDNLDDLLETTSDNEVANGFTDLTDLSPEEASSEIADPSELVALDDFLGESVDADESDGLDDLLTSDSLETGSEIENLLADDFIETNREIEDLLTDNFLGEETLTDTAQFEISLTDAAATPELGTNSDDVFGALNDLLEQDFDHPDEVTGDSLDDLDSLLNDSSPTGMEISTDSLDTLDSLLEDANPSSDAASATDSLDDLDSLLEDDNPLSGNTFADLDDLLSEETSLGNETTIASSTNAIGALDDFSDLEALLNSDVAEPVVPTSTVPITTVSNEAIANSPIDNDSQFDDLDDLLKDAEQKMGGTPSIKPSRGVAPQTRRPARPGRVFSEQTMRVSVKHLDNLSNLVGELVVNRNSLEQDQERLRQSLDNLLYQVQQLSDVGQRMQDLYERSLLESSLLASRHGHRMSAFAIGSRDTAITTPDIESSSKVEYDPLEMDRFTGFHSLSQEMIELIVRVRESSSDIEFIVDETEQVTRMFRQVTTQLQEGLTRSRMVPFAQTADRLPRAVRDISMKIGKQAELVIEGRDTLIDKMILEQLYDPMTHLVNNAITHGIETPEKRRASGKPPAGRITIRAFHQGNQTIISVSDDGAGIDVERVKAKAVEKGLFTRGEIHTMSRLDIFDILFHPGFSTKDQADDFSGRGVGMDVVRTSLSEIRGAINTDSTLGKGTTFTIRLPLTLSISKALCCISDRARIAFPMDGVEDMLDIPKERIQKGADGKDCIAWRDTILPVHPLSELLAYNRHLGRGNVYGGNQEDDIVSVVVLRSAGNFLALQVDQVLGEQEIVIKQLEGPVPKPVGVAGATVLGDGRIMPIADVLELIDLSMGRIRRDAGGSLWDQGNLTLNPEAVDVKTEPMVLIVDDSITVRELLSMTFNKVGYRVEQARDGQEAWEKLRSGLPCDIVFCDIEMPRMDGLELLSRIQKDPNLKQLPIAMLTSRGADRHRQMAASLGASGYFTKPYLEEALLDAAQRMLKGERLLTT